MGAGSPVLSRGAVVGHCSVWTTGLRVGRRARPGRSDVLSLTGSSVKESGIGALGPGRALPQRTMQSRDSGDVPSNCR